MYLLLASTVSLPDVHPIVVWIALTASALYSGYHFIKFLFANHGDSSARDWELSWTFRLRAKAPVRRSAAPPARSTRPGRILDIGP